MANAQKASSPPMRPPRGGHFAEVERATRIGPTLRRLGRYFAGELPLVLGTLAVVLGSTLCTVDLAPPQRPRWQHPYRPGALGSYPFPAR